MDEASRQQGQATVELVAGLPILLLAGLASLQLFAVGYALTLADGAAEAAAIAIASEGKPAEAARAALPGWASDAAEVSVSEGRVTVAIEPPSLISGLSDRLEVRSSASVREPDP